MGDGEDAARPGNADAQQPGAEPPQDGPGGSAVQPVWCVVANVVFERKCGPGGAEVKRGTKHFAPGAKVYACTFYSGDVAQVCGRHRKSHRWMTILMSENHLANWRVEMVYSPYVIDRRGRPPEFDTASDKAWLFCESIVAAKREAGIKTQPFVTRSPVVG